MKDAYIIAIINTVANLLGSYALIKWRLSALEKQNEVIFKSVGESAKKADCEAHNKSVANELKEFKKEFVGKSEFDQSLQMIGKNMEQALAVVLEKISSSEARNEAGNQTCMNFIHELLATTKDNTSKIHRIELEHAETKGALHAKHTRRSLEG